MKESLLGTAALSAHSGVGALGDSHPVDSVICPFIVQHSQDITRQPSYVS